MDQQDDYDILDYEFEIVTDDSGREMTLICHASRAMSPDEYAEALIAFAQQIGILSSIATDGTAH